MSPALGNGRLTVAVLAMLAVTAAATAAVIPKQEVWQADVRVQALEVTPLRVATNTATSTARAAGGQLSMRAVITSDNDDDARRVRLEVLLPIGVGVLRLGPGCQAGASAVSTLTGRVTCDLGDIPVRGLREVVITTTGPVNGGGGRFAVFVTSDTPDPLPSNNYSERAIQ
ncbi:MAG TPA: hypothetical protein VJ672_07610 [Gemmatimonadaceae bacterium]|nr:hypothetical protein [Gemmatimonadaceae bacterium]